MLQCAQFQSYARKIELCTRFSHPLGCSFYEPCPYMHLRCQDGYIKDEDDVDVSHIETGLFCIYGNCTRRLMLFFAVFGLYKPDVSRRSFSYQIIRLFANVKRDRTQPTQVGDRNLCAASLCSFAPQQISHHLRAPRSLVLLRFSSMRFVCASLCGFSIEQSSGPRCSAYSFLYYEFTSHNVQYIYNIFLREMRRYRDFPRFPYICFAHAATKE